MRLRPFEKSVRCLQNFERKKLPEISMFLNDDPYFFSHTTYSLNRFSRLVHFTHWYLAFLK